MAPELNHSKADALKRFLEQVSSEIAAQMASARAAHQAATHEESKAEDRHDTFAIEASYLAAGQSARVMELEKVRTELEGYLSGSRESDRVVPGSLLSYESDGAIHWVLMAKSGGGFRTSLGTGGQEVTLVQILSTTSPLGSELLGLRAGDEIEVEIRGSVREFRIQAVR
jgi:hypothetical protein